MIRFQCPNCGRPQTSPDATAGETGRCSYCEELFDIPQPRPAAVLRVVCPGCDKTLGLPAAAAGKPAKCPACGIKFLVPDDLEPEPAPAPKPRPRPAPPPRRRPRDEDDDEPVSRRRRVYDDDDDDDDDDDERPSRRSRAKPKKRRRAGGGGMPEWYGGPLGRLAENAVITLLLALLALASPMVAGWLLIGWGFVLASVSAIWFLVLAGREGVDQVLLNLFIPFYSVYYAITRWDDVKHPVTLNLIGGAQYTIGILLVLAPLLAMLRELQGVQE
ncbi:MAG TPA: hypothetical protein VD866_13375 [Urbifossiella sp.]|nr:hypothetical protein [Urbifossiella sp.]